MLYDQPHFRAQPGRACLGLAGILALAVGSAPVRAVTDEEIFRDLRFNFINPGGRSLGMGGAFISIADDATAAQANPAGLTNVFDPQFFLELRRIDPESVETVRSFRDPFRPDEGFDVVARTDSSLSTSPTFLSYVAPYGRFSFGVSRHELLDVNNRTVSSYGFFVTEGSDLRTGEGQVELSLTNWNLSAGYRIHDRFRIGATASYGDLSMSSQIVNTFTDPTGAVLGDPALAGSRFEVYRTTIDGADTDWTLTVGALVKITERIKVGAVWRQGGSFSVEQELTAQPVDRSLLPGRIAEQVYFNESGTLLTAENTAHRFETRLNIPDTVGLGISWVPLDRLTLSADAVKITYSDLLEGFNSRLNILTFGFPEEEQAAFTVDDQTNLHVGAEYLLPQKGTTTWVIRAGFHQDKDSRIRADFAPGDPGLGSNENFPGREDDQHYSAGIGVVLNQRFQIDATADFSDFGTEAVVSFIYSF